MRNIAVINGSGFAEDGWELLEKSVTDSVFSFKLKPGTHRIGSMPVDNVGNQPSASNVNAIDITVPEVEGKE